MKTLLVLCAAVSLVAQAADFPATPKGQFARHYVEAFNAGEVEMKAFLEQLPPGGPPIDQRLDRYRQIKADLGSIVPATTPRETADGVEFTLKAKSGEMLQATLLISGPPLQLGGVRLQPAEGGDGPPASAGPPADERTIIGDVQRLVADRSRADAFSGTALIAKGSVIVWQGAFGEADKSRALPNRMTTRFDVGSIAKLFTRTAIAQLVEQGKVTLGDVVGKFLPDYPNATVRDRVTIAELLDMRSGIGDFFGDKFQAADKSRIRTLQDYVPLFATDPLQFEPGTSNAYSNGGYIVLGLIIEKASGQTYYDYVEQHIFRAAGMTNSAFGYRDSAVSTAIGYTKRGQKPDGQWSSNIAMMPARGSSAGSFQSTAEDLSRFVVALDAGKLMSPATASQLQINAHNIGIAGGAPGLNASMDSGIGRPGYTLVVMSNYDPPSAEALAREIRALLQRVR